MWTGRRLLEETPSSCQSWTGCCEASDLEFRRPGTRGAIEKTIVVGLGENAILRDGERGTVEEQFRNMERACAYLVPLIRDGHRVILTHGNGPQVGNLLIQQEEKSFYEYPPQV